MNDSPLSLRLHCAAWNKSTIGAMALLIKDGTHGTHARVEEGIPLLSAVNITSSGKVVWNSEASLVSQADYDFIHSNYQLEFDDLLLTLVGTLGRRALVKRCNAFTIQRSVGVIRVRKESISPEFLFHFAGGDYFQRQMQLRSNATAQAGLYLGELAKIEVALPPLPEQQKIASILTSVDDVIEKTEAQISKLQDLKQGMMQELLTKGIGHTEFKDSPLGSIPKSWEIKQLDEIRDNTPYSLVGGPFGSDLTSNDYVADPGVPVIRGVNLSDPWKKFHDADFVYVSEEKANQLTRNSALPGDFVFTQRGTLGQVGIIPENANYKSYIISQSQMKLTPDTEILNVEYLYQYFRSRVFLKLIDISTIATGLPHINLGILKALPVAIPGRDEQCRIAEILISVDRKISGKLTILGSARLLKKSLMQDLLTGKIRVKAD